MIKSIAVTVSLLFAVAASAAQAQEGWERVPAERAQSRAIPPIQVCRSCGGNWPRIVGGIAPRNGEILGRGENCAGRLRARTEFYPYICSR